MAESLYDIPLKRIDGTATKLDAFRGKVLLVVNVASKCGLTPQYTGLEKLYQAKHAQGLEVLGFPANNFGAQEPGSNAEIGAFCKAKFGVTFPMFSKISVKGSDKAPLYQFLTDKNTKTGGEIPWNFTKYLVDREGKVLARFDAPVEPMSKELTSAIEAALHSK
jgi:glutathione peroxidase